MQAQSGWVMRKWGWLKKNEEVAVVAAKNAEIPWSIRRIGREKSDVNQKGGKEIGGAQALANKQGAETIPVYKFSSKPASSF